MAGRPKVVVTNPSLPQIGLDLLHESCEVVICEGYPPTKADIVNKVTNADAILWVSDHRLDKSVLDAAGKNLKAVSTLTAGFDNIDVSLLKSQGIKVGNTGIVYAASFSVAEVAVALTLIAAHRIQEGYLKIIKGESQTPNIYPTWLLGQQLSGSVIGIVGLGRIGFQIAMRLKGFNVAKLLYNNLNEVYEARQLGAELVSKDELIRNSDFIIVTCPLTADTKHMFNKEVFNKMKSSAIIINTGRGELINQDDLVDALINKTIAGAALDVTTPEPLPQDHPLTKLDNCVLSPHLGSSTRVARNQMSVVAAKNILAALNGEPMLSPI